MATKRPVISLLTDFGVHDHFVGVMKGVIATLNPDALVIDICHDILPQNILQAAFLLKNAYPYFPTTTIHLVVVDPDVGTHRRAIVASSENGYFVAPDNGVLSYIFAEAAIGEVREITADHYFLKPRSKTFDGRDVFAPVGAWMSKGVSCSSFGEVITDYKKIELPQPTLLGRGIVRCKILHIDRFGNLISNLTQAQFQEQLDASETKRFAFRVGEQTVSKIYQTYAEGEKNELFAIFGSSELLEFTVNQGNAASVASLTIGSDILCKVV